MFQPGGSLLRRTIESIFMSHNVAAARPHAQHQLAAAHPGHGRAVRRHRADRRSRSPNSSRSDEGLAGAIEILPIAFDIDVQPYSLITARNRVLSPAAKLLYREIEESIGGGARSAAGGVR